MPTLHISRLKCIAAEAYKCIYNLYPEYIRDLVELKQSVYNFSLENTARVPTVKTTAYGKRSFRFEAARVWISLPNEMRTTNSSLTSGDWSAPGPAPNADAPSAVVLEVSLMLKLKVVEGHVCLTLALHVALHRNPCARLIIRRMHV